MEGASRRSLATIRTRFDAVTTTPPPGSSAPRPDLDRIGADLQAVATLLGREPGLRRALTDPGVPVASRTGLVDRLVASQVAPESLQILHAAVEERWSRSADLRRAVAELGVEAVLALAQNDGALDDVEDELFRFGRILDQTPQLSLALTDPALPADRKKALLERLLSGRTHPATLRLVDGLVADADGGDLVGRLEGLTRIAAARRQRVVARVRTARPLDDGQIARLRESLGRYFGRDVQLQLDLDPGVVGGVVVRVGDEVVDGSVARRLATARRRLLR